MRRIAPLASAALVALLLVPAAPAAGQGVSPVPFEGFERQAEKTTERSREANRDGAAPAPRLVVALLLDQFRDDFLDRFRPVFGRDGFRRIVDGGARFHDCNIPYATTLTGPGHATWLSGTSPAVHGIVANEWWDVQERRSVTAADDPGVRSVGVPEGARGEPGSPLRMRAQTVSDVLRAATQGAARVVSISDKARGAILAGGRRPNGAYWLDDRSGVMQTSDYYMNALPAWAVEANTRGAAAREAALSRPWKPALPAAAYVGTAIADPDDVFPHPIGPAGRDATGPEIDRISHPVALEALFDFAEAALVSEGLGDDATPDLLILSVSITDRVGHRYGPDSPEVLDMAHRVDVRLATFLSKLDRVVGRGRWALSLTADHGVATSPTVARRFEVAPEDSVGGISGTRINQWIDRVIGRALAADAPKAANRSRWARSIGSGFVTFSDSVLDVAGVTREQAAKVVADSAAANPWFAAGFTAAAAMHGGAPGTLAHKVALSFMPGRSGDVVLIPRPYVYFGSGPTFRASHGTPYRYDTHVPFVLYGWGVRRGSYRAPTSTVDIGPTMAALLGVDAPAQSEGRVLHEGLAIPEATVPR